MVFTSLTFLIFFAVFLLLYRLTRPSLRLQNLLILIASYIFYGWWDWRFLGLLFFSSTVDYLSGLWIAAHTGTQRRRGLYFSLISNLVVLFFFKYFNFFADSAQHVLQTFGFSPSWVTLEIVLPVGISFYTFQAMSYTIDVYRGKVRAERDFVTFLAYLAFFPQLVAGPIERAADLLGQFHRPRSIDEQTVRQGIWLIAWGFFLKMVVGDGAAPLADLAFTPKQQYGWTVILGTVAFALQIYGDFAGYSLIAKGTAALLGFELVWNFDRPYWSTSVQELWRRWHITLGSWLRDYLYIPLGGNRRGEARTYANLIITMVLGGLWHGAAWNFVAWGALHGVAMAVERALGGSDRPNQSRQPRLPTALRWAITMTVILVGWYFFRARSLEVMAATLTALSYLAWTPGHTAALLSLAALTCPVFLMELYEARTGDRYVGVRLGRWSFAMVCSIIAVLCYAMTGHYRSEFIYFQF